MNQSPMSETISCHRCGDRVSVSGADRAALDAALVGRGWRPSAHLHQAWLCSERCAAFAEQVGPVASAHPLHPPTPKALEDLREQDLARRAQAPVQPSESLEAAVASLAEAVRTIASNIGNRRADRFAEAALGWAQRELQRLERLTAARGGE